MRPARRFAPQLADLRRHALHQLGALKPLVHVAYVARAVDDDRGRHDAAERHRLPDALAERIPEDRQVDAVLAGEGERRLPLTFACEVVTDDPQGQTRLAINQALASNDLTLDDFDISSKGTLHVLSFKYSGHRSDSKKFILELWNLPGIKEVKQL